MKHFIWTVGVALALTGFVRAEGAVRGSNSPVSPAAPEQRGDRAAEGATAGKYYSRGKAFRIPFELPEVAREVQEVQLWLSRNGGRWEKHSAAPPDLAPDKRFFMFRAELDSDFAFAVRTMSRSGKLDPEDEADLINNHIRVIVDTEVPIIELHPITRSGGDVGVEWSIEDRNLDLESLRIEYRMEGSPTWRPVPGVTPKVAGQTSWSPDSIGTVMIRCQVQDLAKNLGTQTLDIATSAAAATRSTNVPAEQPLTGISKTRDKPNWNDLPTGRSGGASGLGAGGRRESPSDRTQETRTARTEDRRESGIEERRPAESDENPAVEPPSSRGTERNSTTGTEASRSSARRGGSSYSGVAPANRDIVNDSAISLDYSMDGVGPSGVSVVELWVTADMGRTWQRLAEDADRKPPFDAKLPGEGLFGLTLVVKNGVGIGDRPPQAGDQPQSWVEVDATPPAVRLSAPELGKGLDAGSVVITWQADDSNLGDRCVSLFYAEGPKGDWRPIVTSIENSGKHVWKSDGAMPFRFRVAIEVVDKAGNRQMQESDEITLDMSKPRARISSVNPSSRR